MIRAAFLCLALAAAAQAQPDTDRAVLTVQTIGPGVLLVDGVGPALTLPLVIADRAVGDTVRLAYLDDLTAWNPRRTDADVVLAAGETTVRLELPVRTRVETLPLGAHLEVVYASGERVPLGLGPAVIDLPVGEQARVLARLADHLDAQATLPSSEPVTLILPPVGQPDADPVTLLPMRGGTRTRTLVDVGIGALAAAAGAVAVHYKFRADRLDDAYREEGGLQRGDESLLDDIGRYDTYSNVALAGMQVGLGVLAVRFILR